MRIDPGRGGNGQEFPEWMRRALSDAPRSESLNPLAEGGGLCPIGGIDLRLDVPWSGPSGPKRSPGCGRSAGAIGVPHRSPAGRPC
jgi:hypothetical protein